MTIDWNHFSPVLALFGGLLIGLATVVFLFGLGRVAGGGDGRHCCDTV